MARDGREGWQVCLRQPGLPRQCELISTREKHMTAIISCVFDNYGAAAEGIRQLQAAGLSRSQISVLSSNADGGYPAAGSPVEPKHDKGLDGGDDRAEGAAAGAGIGAVALGAI